MCKQGGPKHVRETKWDSTRDDTSVFGAVARGTSSIEDSFFPTEIPKCKQDQHLYLNPPFSVRSTLTRNTRHLHGLVWKMSASFLMNSDANFSETSAAPALQCESLAKSVPQVCAHFAMHPEKCSKGLCRGSFCVCSPLDSLCGHVSEQISEAGVVT